MTVGAKHCRGGWGGGGVKTTDNKIHRGPVGKDLHGEKEKENPDEK
jgi:hypothetical protein